MRFSIHRITEKDIDKITNVFTSVFTSNPWNEPWSYETSYNRLNTIIQTPGYIGIAYYDESNELIGFLAGNEEQWADRKTFYINEICVLQNIQQKGVGSSLLKELKIILKEKGISSLYLSTERGVGMPELFFLKNEFVTIESRITMESYLS